MNAQWAPARKWAAVLVVLHAAGCGGGSHRGPAPGEPLRLTVVDEGDATAAALAVTVPGSAWEEDATSGLTLLSARTLLEQIAPQLDALGASSAIECDHATFTFTVVAPPAEFATAGAVLLDGIFRSDPGEAALERAREELGRTLRLDASSPTWQSRLAARQALYGEDSAWGTPACGVPETLPLFTLQDVRSATTRFRPGLATAAAVGAVHEGRTRALLARHLEPRAERGPAANDAVAPPRSGPGRRYVERNTITAWVAVAFPFGAGTDPAAIDLLGAVLVAGAAPAMDRPEVFDARAEVSRHASGGALILHVITTPESAARYALALRSAAETIAGGGVSEHVHQSVLRAHRPRRLRALDSPEARARWLARELALTRPPGLPRWPDHGTVTRRALVETAAGLGPAAVSVVGPRAARAAVLP